MRCAWGNGSSPSLLPIANFCVTHTLTHWHTRHTLTQTQTHLRGRWCVIAWAKVNRSHLLCCSIAWAIWEAHRQAFFASCLFDWLTDKGMDKVEVGYGVWRGETLWLSDWVTGGLTALLNCGLRRHCMYQCVETSLLAFDSRPPAALTSTPLPPL